MKVLWLCTPPARALRDCCGIEGRTAHPVPWITGHLAPPPDIDLHIACPAPHGVKPQTAPWQGATLHVYDRPARGRSLQLFSRDHLPLRRLVAELKPDVIHGWGTEDSHALVAERLAPERHVVGVQGVINEIIRHVRPGLRDRLLASLETYTLRRARHVAVESTFVANAVRKLGCHGDIGVVPQPLRPEFLATGPAEKTRDEVLFVGSLVANKGYLEALQAFADGAPVHWRLRIVGSGTAVTAARFQEEVRRLGLGDRILHEQGLDEVRMIEVMREAPVLLLPTRIDSGPTALKEALALGLWPVCFDNSGPGEFIRLAGAGTLVPDGDTPALGAALQSVLAQKPWLDLERRARQMARARELFSRAAAWNGLRALYDRVLAGAA